MIPGDESNFIQYGHTSTNNGTYVSDPTTQTFENLMSGAGAIS